MTHLAGATPSSPRPAQRGEGPGERGDLALLLLLVLARFALHLAFGGEYGFHRDELATIDDARYLAAGYVAYPPVTPLIGRLALELFGPSLSGIRFFAALAQAIAMLLTGLIARELGASRAGQALAAAAAGVAPLAMVAGVLFQYVAFDYLWWVMIAFFAIRLIRTGDARWWLPIGATIGLGMLTKYTIGVFVLGIVAGVVFTPARRFLRSGWLWAGVVVSLAIFAPNFVWQVQHDFVSLEFLQSIHARDVRIGRTEGFVPEQFFVASNALTVPLWIAGLWFFFGSDEGKPYRLLGWMYAVPLLLLIAMEGRGYYSAPAY
ncbi:MAG TPA: glycosyltransferase family 39 protein, partial [Thermoanaerobaculia bacterium]|nr:glycosyltransferase family 39 protein [Thermoanaerobaculia bacterium]